MTIPGSLSAVRAANVSPPPKADNSPSLGGPRPTPAPSSEKTLGGDPDVPWPTLIRPLRSYPAPRPRRAADAPLRRAHHPLRPFFPRRQSRGPIYCHHKTNSPTSPVKFKLASLVHIMPGRPISDLKAIPLPPSRFDVRLVFFQTANSLGLHQPRAVKNQLHHAPRTAIRAEIRTH